MTKKEIALIEALEEQIVGLDRRVAELKRRIDAWENRPSISLMVPACPYVHASPPTVPIPYIAPSPWPIRSPIGTWPPGHTYIGDPIYPNPTITCGGTSAEIT